MTLGFEEEQAAFPIAFFRRPWSRRCHPRRLFPRVWLMFLDHACVPPTDARVLQKILSLYHQQGNLTERLR